MYWYVIYGGKMDLESACIWPWKRFTNPVYDSIFFRQLFFFFLNIQYWWICLHVAIIHCHNKSLSLQACIAPSETLSQQQRYAIYEDCYRPDFNFHPFDFQPQFVPTPHIALVCCQYLGILTYCCHTSQRHIQIKNSAHAICQTLEICSSCKGDCRDDQL